MGVNFNSLSLYEEFRVVNKLIFMGVNFNNPSLHEGFWVVDKLGKLSSRTQLKILGS